MLNTGAEPDTCGICNGDNSGASQETQTIAITGSGGFGKQAWKLIKCSYLTMCVFHRLPYCMYVLYQVEHKMLELLKLYQYLPSILVC